MDTWDAARASSELTRALRYLNKHYVPGADTSSLAHWHEEINAATVAEDPERFKAAVRGYVRAGLAAFERAKGGAA